MNKPGARTARSSHEMEARTQGMHRHTNTEALSESHEQIVNTSEATSPAGPFNKLYILLQTPAPRQGRFNPQEASFFTKPGS